MGREYPGEESAVRRTFGRFSVSASAGYDPQNQSAIGQVEARMAPWRK